MVAKVATLSFSELVIIHHWPSNNNNKLNFFHPFDLQLHTIKLGTKETDIEF